MTTISTTSSRVLRFALAAVALSTAGLALATAEPADAGRVVGRAELHLADGTPVGRVLFLTRGAATQVKVNLHLPDGRAATDAFHGFHIHANNDGANGDGCLADPGAASATWFVSADGHLKEAGQDHAGHRGDLSSLYVAPDGSVSATFTTARVRPSDIVGKVVIFHAGADNFGNIPAADYTAVSDAAVTRTKNTGNAGDRLACGVITGR